MKTTRPILPDPAPPFTTSRLLLRPIKREDLNDYHALRTQKEVMVWTSTGKVDVDLDFTMTWIERHLPPKNTFSFSIEELSNPGKVIGSIGLPYFDPPEVGYMFRMEAWGKGYATETLKAWLETYWALPREVVEVEDEKPTYEREADANGVSREVLRALFESNNAGSRGVLRKCSFKEYGREEVEDTHYPGEGKLVWLDYCVCERPS